jgi:hypothetical protein
VSPITFLRPRRIRAPPRLATAPRHSATETAPRRQDLRECRELAAPPTDETATPAQSRSPAHGNRTRGWYDLVITLSDDQHFEYRYAGHLENDEDSISDPGMGGLI